MDRNDSNSINNKNQITENPDNNVEKNYDTENTADAQELDSVDFIGSGSGSYEAEDSGDNAEDISNVGSTADAEKLDDVDFLGLVSGFNEAEDSDENAEENSGAENTAGAEKLDDVDFLGLVSGFNEAEDSGDNADEKSGEENTVGSGEIDNDDLAGSGSDDKGEEISNAEKKPRSEELDDLGFIGFGSDSYESELFETDDSSAEGAVTGKGEDGAGVKESAGGNGGISLAAGKKIIPVLCVIVGVAALIVIAIGVFGAADRGARPVVSDEDSFMFDNGTTVSGIDISGRTTTEAKTLLEQNKSKFISPVSLSVGVGDKKVELTQDNFDYNLNIDEVLDQIKADDKAGLLTSSRSYSVTATIKSESIDNSVNEICEANNTKPVNARVKNFTPFADERFEYAEEKNGATIDAENLKQQFTQFFESGQSSGSAEAVVTETEPTVTVEFLKENIVELYTYETVSGNTDDATVNMEVSFNACNGSVIEPGEDWSFNARTGDSNLEENGYRIGNVISNDEITDGVGGGLCQSSSTIYVAALYSNMTVVERHEHKWASLYVPTGFDATIDYPNFDLVLKNTSEYQMFLECRVVDKTLYATFWGVHSSNYDYITLGNELLHSDESGYSVKTWREFYKDGEKAWQEDLPESHYDPENGEQFISA